MTRKTIFSFLFIALGLFCQAQQLPGRTIRIADSLSAKELAERNPLLLRAELDSLVKLYAPLPVDSGKADVPVQGKDALAPFLIGGISVLLLFSGLMLVMLYRQRKTFNSAIRALKASSGKEEQVHVNGSVKSRGKTTAAQSPEAMIEALNAELFKVAREKEGLQGVIREYNGIRQEFDTVKKRMQQSYKVKNYPGYDRGKDEVLAFTNVLDTEKAVADFAYEKFLKPVFLITDANKNNPAKMSTADREKLFDLLVSLSFFYIEYLYLRVGDLAVGGTMVERMQALTGGHAFNPGLLKKLNTDAGSRALVVRMALSKAAIRDLSYPVFDETNLNNH